MPYKDPKKQAEFQRKWYKKNKKVHMKRINDRRKNIRDKMRERIDLIKAQVGCVECGLDIPYALDFHHHTPEEKVRGISDLINRLAKREVVNEEILKCVVVCRNHHALIHKGYITFTKALLKSHKKLIKDAIDGEMSSTRTEPKEP